MLCGAVWCNLVKGVQFGATWCTLGQFGSTWFRLVHVLALSFSLVHFCADWCMLVKIGSV